MTLSPLKAGDENIFRGVIITKDDLKDIELFKMYMDSLKHVPSGLLLRDSILKARPHLMDSIQIIEDLFNKQQK